ncbi:MAG: hypothetical protein ACI9Z7_001765, partial [Alteromonas macleodii]
KSSFQLELKAQFKSPIEYVICIDSYCVRDVLFTEFIEV